jgi:DNA-binding Lrp family transcriptional regulator
LDKIDAEIIRVLCQDARTPFKKIGRMLGIGTDTVFRRFKKLKEEGKITGSTIILSSKAIGITGWFAVFIRVRPGCSASVVRDKLSKIPQIYAMVHILGEYDFYLEVGFSSIVELDSFFTTLRVIKEVISADPMIYESHDWPLPTLFTLDPKFLDWLLNIEK